MIRAILFFVFLIVNFCRVAGQDATVFPPDSVKKEVAALKTENRLKVDGHLDEQEWKMAKSGPRFIQVEPFQGNAATQNTDLKVVFNKEFLYLGVFAKDSLGKKAIRAVDFKRDFNFLAHDLITFSFDGFNDKRNAMAIAVNPYGVQRDLLSFDDTYYDVDWDGVWRVRTSRTDSGWVAEVSIPWQTLRYPKVSEPTQDWGFNVYRNRRLTNEITAFSPFPRSFSSVRMDYAGILKGLEPPPPKPNVRFIPYFLTAHNRNSGDPNTASRSTDFKLGGEIKWAINPNAILDLTVNTDFAQADADRQVNNTTRFSVFFPERRQFFLENASLFGMGISRNPDESGGNMRIQPFFSRRIGLDDLGNPIPIDFGARFVHRSEERNYGAILIRQRGDNVTEPTNFFVGRFSENFGRQNRVGGMLTIKNQAEGSNIAGTVDGFFRIDESQSINTMASFTNTTATGKQGVSAYAQYYFVSNQFKIWWTQSVVTKNYDPQLGFVSRNDVIGTTPGIFWWYRGKRLPFRKWLRAWEPSIFPEFYHQASTGKLIEKSWTCYPIWLNLQSGAYFGYNFSSYYQNLTDPFEPLGVTIATGRYNYFRQLIYAGTNPSKKINLQTIYQWGSYFNGSLNSGEWALQIAPAPYVSITGRFYRNRFFGVGENATSATIDLYAIEGRFAVNPRVQLITFYQQNAENNSRNYQVRLSLEYKPLSYIYVVINHREFQDPALKMIQQDQAIAKISYLKQF